MFHVYTQAFCGMTIPHGEYEARSDAIHRAERRIASLEARGYDIERISPTRWEILGDNSCVSDFCGVLTVSKDPPIIQ